MDRNAVKTFATWARRHLREQATARLDQFGITPTAIAVATPVTGGLTVSGQVLDAADAQDYQQLLTHLEDLQRQEKTLKAAVERLIDEIAYTWFNRLAALRFMEVNGYLGQRVISSSDPSLVDPDLLRDAGSIAELESLPGLTLDALTTWRDQASRAPNPDEALYRRMLGVQCQALSESLPFLFDPQQDYLTLFMPGSLLNQDSIIRRLVNDIPETDWRDSSDSENGVEIIGWLYQFYISERKDEVIGAKSKIAAHDIPAATQLFTPHWIVRYMVENSLGRLWLEGHPESGLRAVMKYYLESLPPTVTTIDETVDSRQLTVGSGGNITDDEKLQGSARLAEGDGSGSGDLSTQQDVSEGRTIRSDESGATGSGLGAVQHSGRTGSTVQGGVSQLSINRSGVVGRGRDSTADRSASELSDRGRVAEGDATTGGGEQNVGSTPEISGQLTGNSSQLTVHSSQPVSSSQFTVHSSQQETPLKTGNRQLSTLPPLATGNWQLTTDPQLATGNWQLSTDSQLTTKNSLPTEPQELTVLDPACGSGHILVYAFDLLFEIYKEQGYRERDIPALILAHNLHGLDIDERAVQLASFAVLMKARAKNPRFFRDPSQIPHLKILTVRSTRPLLNSRQLAVSSEQLAANSEQLAVSSEQLTVDSSQQELPLTTDNWQLSTDPPTDNCQLTTENSSGIFSLAELNREDWLPLLEAFKDADNLGSLITPPVFDGSKLLGQVEALERNNPLFGADAGVLRGVVEQAELLRGRYWVVVANPPYMGGGSFNPLLKDFIVENFDASKGDLFAVFMERGIQLGYPLGLNSAINQHSWMFSSSYDDFRNFILSKVQIVSLIHLGIGVFRDLNSKIVQSTSFILRNQLAPESTSLFIDLTKSHNGEWKRLEFSRSPKVFTRKQVLFKKIPGNIIAYWLSDKALKTFDFSLTLEEFMLSDGQTKTGNNDKYLRLHWLDSQKFYLDPGLDLGRQG